MKEYKQRPVSKDMPCTSGDRMPAEDDGRLLRPAFSLPTPPRPLRLNAGFTLIEILVALGVLGIVLALFTQIVGHVENVTTGGRRRLDVDSTAQLTLDRIARDLSTRASRADVDWLLQKNTGDDAVYFFSEAPGYCTVNATQSDTIALIGYRTALNAQGYKVLERVGKALPLTGGDQFYHLPTGSLAISIANLLPEDAQTLTDGLVRFEIEFLLSNGDISDTIPLRSANSKDDLHYLDANGKSAVVNANKLPDWDSVTAVIVTIALIDSDRGRILTEGQIEAIASQLPDAALIKAGGNRSDTGPGSWQKVIESGAISQAARGAIRVYSKSIPIHE